MMGCRRAGLLVLSVAAAAGGHSRGQTGDTRYPEPPVSYVLKLGDRTFPLEADSPVELTDLPDAATAVLSVAPERTFNHIGITFPYPQRFNYQVEEKEDVTGWVLSAGDTRILVTQTQEPDMTAETLVSAFLEQFRQRMEVQNDSDWTLATAQGDVAGHMLVMRPRTRGGLASDMTVHLYAIGVTSIGRPVLIVANGVTREGTAPSAELNTILRLLQRLTVTP